MSIINKKYNDLSEYRDIFFNANPFPYVVLDDFLNYAELTSPLGNASAEECANYTISLFSDYTRKVTLQNLFNDGGFSNVGVSQEIIDKLNSK